MQSPHSHNPHQSQRRTGNFEIMQDAQHTASAENQSGKFSKVFEVLMQHGTLRGGSRDAQANDLDS
eukprot:5291567-Amphidinium_carterae.1